MPYSWRPRPLPAGRLIYAQDVAVLISSAQQPAIYVPLPQQQLQLQLHSSSTAAAAATVAAWNAPQRMGHCGRFDRFTFLKLNVFKSLSPIIIGN